MTDIRRTLLWVVFSMSLFLIWDAWNKHNGQPSFFSPTPAAKPAAVGAAGSGASAGAVPVPTGTPAPAAATAAPPAASAPTVATAERITITTDVVKATLDSLGGSLDRVELLQQVDPFDPKKHVV